MAVRDQIIEVLEYFRGRGERPDFRQMWVAANLDLENADFSGLDLSSVIFGHDTLNGANFRGANLFRASFGRTELERANFSDANLSACVFAWSNLTNATMRRANLTGAIGGVWGALDGEYRATFAGADLGEACLIRADMTGVDFRDSDLRGAILRGTDFRGANFKGAKLDNTFGEDQYWSNWFGAIMPDGAIYDRNDCPGINVLEFIRIREA